MSTDFFRLKPPVTSLFAEAEGEYVRLSVWVSNAFSGELLLRAEDVGDFVLSLVVGGVCMHTYWGGLETGVLVDFYGGALPDNTVVISAGGEITTVGKVKKLVGRGKKED